MLVWGVILTSAAFIVPPPTGQVHESVMWFLWQILIFCGSIFGIVTYAKSSLGEIEL